MFSFLVLQIICTNCTLVAFNNLVYGFFCLVSGGWSSWGQWSICDNICGGSVINRTRTCDNPSPKGGGPDCNGKAIETKLECAWPCTSK